MISASIFADSNSSLLPMYGGEDRVKNQALYDEDQRFIAKASRSFSSRAHAAEGYVERGFNLYSENKLEKAMQHFNQAWLLNPGNPYSYLGFGILLNKKEQSCKAMMMLMLSHTKGLNESGFLADYGLTTSTCALSKSEAKQKELFDNANKIFEQAIKASNKLVRAYAYHAWAKSYMLQQDYRSSKTKIEKSKSLGGTIDSSLESIVNEKLKTKN